MSPGHAESSTGARRHLIVGTAGHIDHGKSALVRALTGVDPDRLPEEKSRGMTIVLGFAPLQLDDLRLGIVDVPGHERFVRTMVAGATGVDLALLVVAADDGVMPQTVEHAEILDVLGVTRGVVAVNKADLAGARRLAEVHDQVRELLKNLSLADSPIVSVSAATGEGLDALRQAIARQAVARPARDRSPIFRLAIDRVFTVKGRGTVVTGSVLSGTVAAGDTLELMPSRLTCRVRELQTHSRSAESLGAGQRAALNLVGVDRSQIEHGHELATPGYLTPTHYLDARLRVLARASSVVKSHARLRVAMGTAEQIATIVTLDQEPIAPGQSKCVQLRSRRPLVAAHGQRFIVRDETASRTLGGGVILRPVSRRWAPGDRRVAEALAGLDAGSPADRLAAARLLAGFADETPLSMACQAGVHPDRVGELTEHLLARGTLVRVAGLDRPVHRETVTALAERSERRLLSHHSQHPNDVGLSADTLTTWLTRRSAKGLGRALLDELVRAGRLQRRGAYVCHPSFAPALSEQDQRVYDAMLAELREAAFCPPALEELSCARRQNVQRLRRLAELAKSRGCLVQIDQKILLHADRWAELKDRVRALIEREGPATVSQIRQELGTTRKYIVPIMEYLDRLEFTRRQGDRRSLA